MTSIQEGCGRGTWFGSLFSHSVCHTEWHHIPLKQGNPVRYTRKSALLKKYRYLEKTSHFLCHLQSWVSPVQKVHSRVTEINMQGTWRKCSLSVMGWGFLLPPPHFHPRKCIILCFLLMMTGSLQAFTCPHLRRPDWFPWNWSTAHSL